jgi:acetyl esterase/lipase
MAASEPNDVIKLWPKGPPTKLEGLGPEASYQAPVGVAAKATMLRNVSEATLSVYRPAKPNGVGIVVCPGGGWRILAWEHEGTDVVTWLTGLGYTAFLLKYRVRGTPESQAEYEASLMQGMSRLDLTRTGKTAYRTIGEIAGMVDGGSGDVLKEARAVAADDGRRAVAVVRERAKEFDIDPNKIGMLGFSAGAFLVADVAMDAGGAPQLAFVAPIYGGETTGKPVPADAPPMFTCIAQDDFLLYRVVEGLYSDWTDAGRSAELHIYRRGAHGFGMVKQGFPSDRWTEHFHEWLVDLGFK